MLFYLRSRGLNKEEAQKVLIEGFINELFDEIKNSELKKKYKAKVVGFKEDYKRIPEIDIKLNDGQIWKEDNFEAKVLHIPGHTLGHICFYFYNDNNLFTGDTLFSLGCGRIFEGTYQQMFSSLEKIKKLPPKTKS